MHYPLIQESNQRPYHFIHGYTQYLEQQLGVKIPITRFSGDIHLSVEEKNSPAAGSRPGKSPSISLSSSPEASSISQRNGGTRNPSKKSLITFKGKFNSCSAAKRDTGIRRCKESSISSARPTPAHSFGWSTMPTASVCSVTFAMHLAAAVETETGPPQAPPLRRHRGGRNHSLGSVPASPVPKHGGRAPVLCRRRLLEIAVPTGRRR